jgi:hypothetical protein
MDTIIEGTPHIPLMSAARELETTHLRILMLLKHNLLTGHQLEGEWYIEKDSLACLKSHGMSPLEQASCRTSCTASACGCGGR